MASGGRHDRSPPQVDIDTCYAASMQSGEQLAVRDCLVYDDFADRFAAQVDRLTRLGMPPLFQPAAVCRRLAICSGPAGCTDSQIMSGYLDQGSNEIFAVIASRIKPGQ